MSSSVAEPGELADHPAGGLRAHQQARAAGAVVGARAVGRGAAPELAPDVHEHAVGDAARLEVGLERGQRGGQHAEVLRQRRGLVLVRVVAAVGVERDDLQRQVLVDHVRERGEPLRERMVGGRVGDRVLPGAGVVLEPGELAAQRGAHPGRATARLQLGVGARDRALRAPARDRGVDHRLLPDVAHPDVVGGRVGDRGDGDLAAGQGRRERVVEREALQRVVRVAVTVQVAAQPADPPGGVGRADLPVVARGEVRLVRVVVADRGDHGQPAGGVQVAEGGRVGVPAQPVVLGERERGVRRAARGRRAAPRSGSRRRARAATASPARRRRRSRRAPGPGRPPGRTRCRPRSARGLSAPPPNTASARPAERETNERRERPVPAGSGMPGSIGRRPRPAVAAPLRSSSEREKPAQPQEEDGFEGISWSGSRRRRR